MMDENCNDIRDVITQTACTMTSRIAENKRRLLDEVESFRAEEYNRRCTTRGRFSEFVTELTEVAELAGMMRSGSGCRVDYQLNYLNYLEDKIRSEKLFSPSRNSWLIFCAVKCNATFGTLAVNKQTKMASYRELRKWQAASPPVGRPRSHTWHSNGGTRARPEVKRPLTANLKSVELSSPSVQLLWKISQEGAAVGEVSCPNDVIFLGDGDVIVSEKTNRRLQRFNSLGQSVAILAAGNVTPSRLAANKDGRLLVTDSDRNRLVIVDASGRVSDVAKKLGSAKCQLGCPRGIAVNSRGQYILSDGVSHRVMIHDKDGGVRPLRPGASLEFMNPSYVGVGTNDRILISDNWQQQVFVFDENGSLLFELSNLNSDGGGGDELQFPNGVCIGHDGNMFVANWGNHTVSEFSRHGKFLGFALTRSSGLRHPAGIAYRRGCLAVTEMSDRHSSVAVYRLAEDRKSSPFVGWSP
ncbi:hypothetical protein LSH36_1241g00010 [Paralvinella palmiformis]|uniref:Uncharacterized protein n=1 Tax=Paralvinella palmiformis TaxID=53620 RepID=A0AAD9IUX9_9ANNE|nr:hypothetical protein LSH36_1241g00010 [Paralvinella palmiformis]